MDPKRLPDPELGKFKAGSGFGINHFGSTTLGKSTPPPPSIFGLLGNRIGPVIFFCPPFCKGKKIFKP